MASPGNARSHNALGGMRRNRHYGADELRHPSLAARPTLAVRDRVYFPAFEMFQALHVDGARGPLYDNDFRSLSRSCGGSLFPTGRLPKPESRPATSPTFAGVPNGPLAVPILRGWPIAHIRYVLLRGATQQRITLRPKRTPVDLSAWSLVPWGIRRADFRDDPCVAATLARGSPSAVPPVDRDRHHGVPLTRITGLRPRARSILGR